MAMMQIKIWNRDTWTILTVNFSGLYFLYLMELYMTRIILKPHWRFKAYTFKFKWRAIKFDLFFKYQIEKLFRLGARILPLSYTVPLKHRQSWFFFKKTNPQHAIKRRVNKIMERFLSNYLELRTLGWCNYISLPDNLVDGTLTFRHDNVGSNFWNVNHQKRWRIFSHVVIGGSPEANTMSIFYLMDHNDLFFALWSKITFSHSCISVRWMKI